MTSLALEFRGYWREINKKGVPALKGVYCVYRATYNQNTDRVLLAELLYVGQSENANERLVNHERLQDWIGALGAGEELCYSFAPVGAADLDAVEAALIYSCKPRFNADFTLNFPYGAIDLILMGCAALLPSRIALP